MTSQRPKILLFTLPRVEIRAPIVSTAQLKPVIEANGWVCKTIDFNVDLWHILNKSCPQIWLETDLSFRYSERFDVLWSKTLKPIVEFYFQEKIASHRPDMIGLSLFSQRCSLIAKKIATWLKDTYPKIQLIIGGPFTHYVSENWTRLGLVDYAVVGEGEDVLASILSQQTKNPVVFAPQIQDLDKLPYPDYSDFDFSKYSKAWWDPSNRSQLGLSSLYINGTRGCVRKCSFCDVSSIWPKFRYRSGELIAEEMITQSKNYGVRHFLFTDSLINGHVKELVKLCKSLITNKEESGIELTWQGQFIARPKISMPDEVYRLLKKAGCHFVSVGIESGSEKVRHHMNKKFSNDDLHFTLNACWKNKISVALLLMVGYPTETESDFQETLNLLTQFEKMNAEGLVRSVVLGPTTDIIPGTPLDRKKQELGIINDQYGNWVYKDNNKALRIRRWLRLKEHAETLGYDVLEKAKDHLYEELAKYESIEMGPSL